MLLWFSWVPHVHTGIEEVWLSLTRGILLVWVVGPGMQEDLSFSGHHYFTGGFCTHVELVQGMEENGQQPLGHSSWVFQQGKGPEACRALRGKWGLQEFQELLG